MFSITVEGHFCAAHVLPGVEDCKRLHGHNWKVEAEFRTEHLNEHGFALDFREAKAALTELTDRLDHRTIFPQVAHCRACEITPVLPDNIEIDYGGKIYILPAEDTLFLEGEDAVTAECLAQWFYFRLTDAGGVLELLLYKVTVWETPRAHASYWKEEE